MKQQDPLSSSPKLHLLDETGQPLRDQIQAIIFPLENRFRLKFSGIQDDATVQNLFDRAGQLYSQRELTGPKIEKPEGFAWKILCNLATSELRRSEEQIVHGSVSGVARDKVLRRLSTGSVTEDQLVNRIYAKEMFEQLSETEQRCATLKTLGFRSVDVARALNMTTFSVDKLMQRLRDRFRTKERGGV